MSLSTVLRPNVCEKIQQFLSSIKKDAQKIKLVPFFLPHSVYTSFLSLIDAMTNSDENR